MNALNSQFEVLRDPATLALRVARWMTDLARAKKGEFAVALSGGSTPQALYQALASDGLARRFPWALVHWFWGDERLVPHQDPLSNYHMAWAAMLAHVPVPATNIHAIPTEGVSAEESARAYERALREFYGADRLDPARPLFDLVLLGLGVDGHTASLFPQSAALDDREHWAAAVQTHTPARITLTYPALESSAHTAFLVTGTEKRSILRGLLEGRQDLPAARLRPTGELRFFVDTAAAD